MPLRPGGWLTFERAERDHRELRSVDPANEQLRPALATEALAPVGRGLVFGYDLGSCRDLERAGRNDCVGGERSTVRLATHGAMAVLDQTDWPEDLIAHRSAKTAARQRLFVHA